MKELVAVWEGSDLPLFPLLVVRGTTEWRAAHLCLGFCFNLCSWALFSMRAIQEAHRRKKKGVFPVMKGTKRKLQRLKTGLYLSLITVALESSE